MKKQYPVSLGIVKKRELYFNEINSSLIKIINNIKKDSNKSL